MINNKKSTEHYSTLVVKCYSRTLLCSNVREHFSLHFNFDNCSTFANLAQDKFSPCFIWINVMKLFLGTQIGPKICFPCFPNACLRK